MKRLTKKYDEKCYLMPGPYKNNWKWKKLCILKLGKYEDIEELCERIEKGKPVYEKSNSGKIHCDYYSTCSVTYNFAKKRIEVSDYNYLGYFEIDKYGKTWAFTKEDLEK